jgi:hypothetical protein
LKKNEKNDHPKIEYQLLEGCLVQSFVELGVKKPEIGEFFDLPKNKKFIPYLEP